MTSDFFIKQNKENVDKSTELYTIIGKHQFLDKNKNPRTNTETNDTCAKKISSGSSVKFFIKTGIYGKIYDPIGLYSEGTSAKFLARAGKKAWDYKQVNNKVFDMYLSFLRTKNKAWLTNAERELN